MAAVAPESKSRYKVSGKKFDDQISAKEIPGLVSDLRKAFHSEKTYSYKWRINQLKQLAKMMSDNTEALCEGMYKDLGKSYHEGVFTEISTTIGEIHHAIGHLKEWMKPEKKGEVPTTIPSWPSTQRDPLGVVLILGAWNYNVHLTLNPVVGAIAAGNCVIIKPGSYAVNSSHTITRLINEYMDPECIVCVEGNREVSSALLKEKFDKIFFTGSGFVGKVVARAAAEHLTPCVLELGGKSPCIVDKSAGKYLEHCVKRVVWASFVNGAQTCVRPDFLMVHEAIAPQFIAKFKQTLREFYSDKPKETEWYSRCINDSAFDRLKDLVNAHKDKIVVGGDSDKSQKYIEPTLLNFGSDIEAFKKAQIMQDEVFGPVFPMATYSDIEQVVDFVKHLVTGKPLALYAFGTDPKFVETIKNRTTSGGMAINDCLVQLSNHNLPFGGVGESGMGSYHGKYSFDCFTHEKAILEKSPMMDELPGAKQLLSIRFPPYPSWKIKVLTILQKPILIQIFSHLPTVDPKNLIKQLLMVYVLLRMFGYNVTKA